MNLDQKIYEIALKNGFNNNAAKIIVAQARLESGHYKSNVFKQNNNMFGMKFVGQPLAKKGTLAPAAERSTHDIATNYYAKYESPEDSAKDLIERLYEKTVADVTSEQLKKTETPEAFAELLKKRGYFGIEAEKYAKSIKSIIPKLSINESGVDEGIKSRDIFEVVLTFAVLGAAYYLIKRYS